MLITGITFFIVLSILVLIHELGHFLAARYFGVHVEEFGLGLPPRITGKMVGKTLLSLNWLPIGGFVKLAGEDEEETKSVKNKDEYFWAKSKKQRSLILIAGVTMNFILAVVITAGLLTYGVNEPSGRVHIEMVTENSPAKRAGLLPGDQVVSVGSVPVKVPGDLIETVRKLKGQKVEITVLRAGQTIVIPLVPRTDPPKDEGPIGVAVSDLEIHKYPLWEAPYMALKINIQRAGMMFVGLGTTIRDLVLRRGTPDVAGPIGIAQVTGQAVKLGWQAVLEFMSLLSLNLAVLNILPIPALDGGRLLFVFIEKFLGRKVRPAFEKQTHQIGMMILLLLILLVSIGDIMRLARGG